jgi:hypothetical protein
MESMPSALVLVPRQFCAVVTETPLPLVLVPQQFCAVVPSTPSPTPELCPRQSETSSPAMAVFPQSNAEQFLMVEARMP